MRNLEFSRQKKSCFWQWGNSNVQWFKLLFGHGVPVVNNKVKLDILLGHVDFPVYFGLVCNNKAFIPVNFPKKAKKERKKIRNWKIQKFEIFSFFQNWTATNMKQVFIEWKNFSVVLLNKKLSQKTSEIFWVSIQNSNLALEPLKVAFLDISNTN